jgi:conjugative transfer pilus assembly protein TraH
MQQKVLDDVELNADEVKLLAKTHLPLYRIINVVSAYKKGVCPLELQQVADLVARDVLVEYLRDALETIKASCGHLRYRVPYADKIDEYILSLKDVERCISQYAVRSNRIQEQERYILEKIALLEKHIAAELCL